MKKDSFKRIMYEYTEWPGDSIPFDDLHFISHRYRRVLELCNSKDVLEIGAGSSIAKKEITNLSKSYTGIDISEKNISRISRECNDLDLSLFVDDAENMQFKDNSFDFIFALAMVYYLDENKFLSEVKRVLRPGGILFFCTSNADVPGFNAAPGSKKYLNIQQWDELLRKHDFNPKFEGVFPHKSIIKLGLRAKIVAYCKLFFVGILGLNSFWNRIREYSKGSLTIIPKHLEDFPRNQEEIIQIKECKDSIHRVIYCISLNNS